MECAFRTVLSVFGLIYSLCTVGNTLTRFVDYRERKNVDTVGTVLVPWAGHFQCYNMNIFFSDKIHGSNFIKQHSETAMV